MKLASIDCQIPSNKIQNEHIIDLVKYYSSSSFDGNIEKLETMVRRYLLLTGIESRFWRSNGENPLELICISISRALNMANLDKSDIDLVIYSSIDRGFIEPANASFICKAAGLKNARSFDIVDACMSWATAVQVSHSLVESNNEIRNAVIVNSEFPMDEIGSVIPANFTISNSNELNWKAPSFTLGEGCSTTIFKKSDRNCEFHFMESPENAEACVIPIMNFNKFINDQNIEYTPLQFYSNGADLYKNGLGPSIKVLNRMLNMLPFPPSAIFPHAVSNKLISEAISKSNIDIPVVSTFTELGNTATVSIPSALSKYLATRKDRNIEESVVAWIASAGMKFGAIEFKI